MKNININDIPDQKEFKKLIPGGYVAKIESVKDFPDKEYLLIEFDIASGQFSGYYADLFERKQFWGGKFYRSYKETALSFFKSFLTAVMNSNKGFEWQSNEQDLVRKKVGIIIGEEEHRKQDGTIGTRTYVAEVRSVDTITSGDFKVPELKKLKGADQFGSTVKDDKIPGWE